MARALLMWLILSLAIGFGISAWRSLAGKEQWQLTKYIAYATLCSAVAGVLLSFIVIMF